MTLGSVNSVIILVGLIPGDVFSPPPRTHEQLYTVALWLKREATHRVSFRMMRQGSGCCGCLLTLRMLHSWWVDLWQRERRSWDVKESRLLWRLDDTPSIVLLSACVFLLETDCPSPPLREVYGPSILEQLEPLRTNRTYGAQRKMKKSKWRTGRRTATCKTWAPGGPRGRACAGAKRKALQARNENNEALDLRASRRVGAKCGQMDRRLLD
ncbi:hypothetical protein BC827DRAFT_923543 [Russula dissimulans]|jgi:hypothetical protein|nr:hypothetical protein BC827DRAFT_923543 [Russula dissimulans]